jgi:uncharacterized protein (TIGR02118 family)
MAKVIAMYRTPADPVAFDRYYHDRHLPLAKTVPGLQRYEVTRGPILTMEGPAPFYLIATLTFASVAAIHSALASPQGQATAADLGKFAMAGVDIYIADTEEI